MPILEWTPLEQGCIYYPETEPAVNERDMWFFVVDVEEPDRQNWRTMVTIRDGEDVFVCNN